MAYRARAPRSRSPRSSLRWGKPTTWRRGTGRRHGKGGRVRDAQEPEPQYVSSTGELIDIERVTISSEGGRWKSTHRGNSLAAYPTSRPVVRPAKAGVFSGSQSHQGKSQKPCSLDGREEGNRISEAHRHQHLRDAGEFPGRSASERTGGPESEQPQRPSLQLKGEGSMGRRRLADAADHSGGVGATAWRQGHAEQLEKPSSSHRETGGAR